MANNSVGRTCEAINTFIKENEGLIHMVLRPYRGLDDYEDLVQEAYIGMIKGLHTYDPNKGSKLTTYVAACAQNEIRMYLRQRAAKSRRADIISLNSDSWPDDDSQDMLDLVSNYVNSKSETMSVEDQVSMRIIYESAIDIIFHDMDPLMRFIIIQFLHGVPQYQTAEKLGITQSKVSKSLKQALAKLRTKMEDLGFKEIS